MPRNNGKGGKNYKRSKNSSFGHDKRQLEYKEDGQEYARITKMLGNSRCECKCNDGRTRLGIIRGTLIKRVWIQLNDLVLVSLRDYQDDKADIIHKYFSEEEKSLRQYGEIDQLSGNSSMQADYIDSSIQESDDLDIDFDDI
tara:strand:- start:15198 stop:15623 length:426 start_codon:yes stop_codon:yes gene_type:complete